MTMAHAVPNAPLDSLARVVYPSVWVMPRLSYFGSRLADFGAARAAVERLSFTERDWDGDGALPISEATKLNALAALNILEASAPAPEITPNPNGTLSLEWETEKGVAYLEIGRTRYSFCILPRDGSAILIDGISDDVSSTVGIIVDELLYDRSHTASGFTELVYSSSDV